MPHIPIHKVHFNFEGSSNVRAALSIRSFSSPWGIEEHIKSHNVFVHDNKIETGVTLFIHMNAAKQSMRFSFEEYQDPSSENFRFDMETLESFEFSIPAKLGHKEWLTYQEAKSVGRGTITNTFQGEASWELQDNLHDALAQRFLKFLRRKNIQDVVYEDDNILKLELPVRLIIMYTEYASMYKNPKLLIAALST